MLFQILSLLFALLQYFHVDCSTSVSSSFTHSTDLCLPEQKAALLEFKSTFSFYVCWGSDYPKTNSWNKSSDCCSWEGIKCNRMTGQVISVDLSHSCLNGSLLVNNNLFHLQNLQWLDLSFNHLSGFLLENSSVFHLQNLQWLDLSFNCLSNSLLENNSLFHLQGLQELNLAFNTFNGKIPSEFFSQLVSLTHLNLSGSGFSDKIPHEISLLSNLVSLDLSINDLRFDAQGFDMLARNLTKLRSLVLEPIDMSGVALTSFLSLSSNLVHLSLRGCELHGEFPSEVFRLPCLQHVDLSWNQILTGHLPKTNLSREFKLLDLSFCGFQGSIPDVFGDLKRITTLQVYSCNFSGRVPTTMFNLTQLRALDLSHNQLEGSLPNHVNRLQLLERFSFSHNLISGAVPSWPFTLPSLKELDLSYNKLTGPIEQFKKPNSIQYIDMRFNNIHGPLPSSFFYLVNLSTLYLSSNNLSGVIEANMLSKLINLHQLDLSNNSLLSLGRSDNDINYSFPQLTFASFSCCSIRQFPSFFRTSNLYLLDLSNNKISGGISNLEAQGWEQLVVLNLSYNFLTTLEQFPGKKVEVLDLQSNLLQGSILSTCLNPHIPNPPQFLSIFLMSDNKLTGSIPSFICNLSSLIILDLSVNSLIGTIPECLGNFSSSLKFMNLQMNKFYGRIPDSFTNNKLRNLFLNNNQLEGSLPRSLVNCSSLEVLNLGSNKLTDTFPHWLASLPRLQVLILRSNRFHGSIHNYMASSNFSALRIIDLSRNELTGPLPANLFQNWRAMKEVPKKIIKEWFVYLTDREGNEYDYNYYPTYVNVTTKRLEIELVKTLAIFAGMDFSNNLFHGKIPEELGELFSLQVLNFSHNKFTSPIPPSLGNLVALESLDLSSNKLSGRIPSQLLNLTFLEVLNLSKNNLVGSIPHGNQFDTFDNDSYSGNLALCGLPLSRQCSNPEGPKLLGAKTGGHESFAIPFFWKVALMGYGCGVVLGLSMGLIVFTTRRRWWIVRMIEILAEKGFNMD